MITLLQAIASTLAARRNCIQSGNTQWKALHEQTLSELEHQLPRGSGFDKGTRICIDECTEKKIVLETAFHHMHANGYTGWSEHAIVITPGFVGFYIRVTGQNVKQVKEYIAQEFQECLSGGVDE
jgi:hypothetical protein